MANDNKNQHGFELLREEHIGEINSLARVYKHIKTGAQFISVMNDDENKTFGIGFATPWNDSTGIAHIMEHSVLCGSRKYPVKEPFIELAKGSLNTFLNAMTYPDKTVYPVASTNTQDLYNLADVYLDAVFYPSITENTLKQEGWHYDLEAKDAPMIFKGVVFNEMKGNYSSPDSLMGRLSQQAVFPDNAYGHDSGGDPKEIPNLSYATFKTFHEQHYHPSNSMIWWYGDDAPEKRLAFLNDWLSAFEPIQVNAKVALQKKLAQPKRVLALYDAGADAASSKSQINVNWLVSERGAEQADMTHSLAWRVLGYILLGTQASPLRKALIDSGLGEDVTGGYEDELRQPLFSAGMKGVEPKNVDAVENLILATLRTLAQGGIETEMIEAAMNTMEFRMREMNTGRFPRGLALWLGAMETWLHGGDPIAPLRYEAPLNALKQQLAKGERMFENLIASDLLNNTHRVSVVLHPDANVREQDDAAERARLDQARASMNDNDLANIVQETHRLREMQETPDTPEGLASIPSLKLSDLEKSNKHIPIAISQNGQAQVVYHDLFTNGIAYVDLGFNVKALPSVALPYVSLFKRLLLSMGTHTESYVRLSQRIGRKTGGLYASGMNATNLDGNTHSAWFFLRGKGTMAQMGDLFDIARDVLLTVKLDDKDRLKQIVLEEKARTESGLIPGGHGVVNTRLKARFSIADLADEQMGGISYLFFLRDLADQIDRDWASVLHRLNFVRQYLINKNNLLVNVTLDQANFAKLQPQLQQFMAALPAFGAGEVNWAFAHSGNNFHEGLTMPSQVNYVGKGANLYALGYALHGSINVINNWLRTTYLWERVRVQGGAYGGFSTFDARSGVWTYLSYRDPNLLKTLDNYDGTPNYLRTHAPSQAEVERAIIGVIGSLDAYELPDAKGFTSLTRHVLGIDDDYRQRIRDEVLATTTQDFVRFADALDAVRTHGQIVVLGSPAAMEQANAERNGLLKLTKVM